MLKALSTEFSNKKFILNLVALYVFSFTAYTLIPSGHPAVAIAPYLKLILLPLVIGSWQLALKAGGQTFSRP